jgi:hypothetical protein
MPYVSVSRLPLGRVTLGPYRKGPGVKRWTERKLCAGAVSIRTFEGSRWRGGDGGFKLWVLNAPGTVEGSAAGLV